jgi:hypothetical protein
MPLVVSSRAVTRASTSLRVESFGAACASGSARMVSAPFLMPSWSCAGTASWRSSCGSRAFGLAERRQRRLAGFFDDALEAAEIFVNLQRQSCLVTNLLAPLEHAAQRKLHKRQHVGPVGVAQQPRMETFASGGVGLEDQTGRRGRYAHDLGKLDRPASVAPGAASLTELETHARRITPS